MKRITSNSSWIILIVFMLLVVSACATRETKSPDTGPGPVLPEVRKITFVGNHQYYSWTLLKAMATKPRPLLRFWEKGDPYNPATLEDDLLRLRKHYFDRGYLDATATVLKVHEEPEKNAVEIEIAIEEGAVTVVKAVRLGGDLPPGFPAQESVLDGLPLIAGSYLDRKDFDRSKSRLLLLMQDLGYARARVIPETEVNRERNTAITTFVLFPGGLTKFGQFTFSGNKELPERVARRQIHLQEGETYSAKWLKDNQGYVYDLGMFHTVTPRILNLDQVDAPLDIDFELNERKPHTLRLGIGASSVESMRYEAEWIHRNFLDEAERLSLLARVSGIQQGLEAKLYEPYFVNRDNSLIHKIFVLNNQRISSDPFGILDSIFNIIDPQPAYDLLSVGVESRLNHKFTKRLKGDVGLELSSNDFYNIDPAAVEEAGLEAVEDNNLFIQFSELEWNGRDDDLNPTKGEFLRGQIEHSNEKLLSDVNFVKLTLEGRYYQPLARKLVLALRLKLGGIEPYGDTLDVPANVRFFAGGPGSVRGFELNRLGPLDANGNPVGGNSLIEGSVELRFPLLDNISGALFVDFGNVFSAPFTYPLEDLRYAVGPGLRYLTPIGPLRVDVGFAIDRQPNEHTSRIEFSIGQAF
ncbi:MAG: outer membrane protein assembly factor BamA [Gammaproteobacteria bacterium]|nr:outer membrane protein assembly factor BamA [Gammaproteobacteria bacterium]